MVPVAPFMDQSTESLDLCRTCKSIIYLSVLYFKNVYKYIFFEAFPKIITERILHVVFTMKKIIKNIGEHQSACVFVIFVQSEALKLLV